MASISNQTGRKATASYRQQRKQGRAGPRAPATNELFLPGIIDEETVETQQDGIRRRAGNQLTYANAGSPGYSAADIERLNSLKTGGLPGWVPEWSFGLLSGLGRIAEPLQRPLSFLSMAAYDALNILDENPEGVGFWDWKGDSLQFTVDDYWDVLAGNAEEVARENPEVSGFEDGDFTFKDIANNGIKIGAETTLRWEQTDAWLNKWGRNVAFLGAEAYFDPINKFTFGLSGVGKKTATAIADIGLRRAGVGVLEAMQALGDDVLEFAVKDFSVSSQRATSLLEKRMFTAIKKRAAELRKAHPTWEIDKVIDEAAGFRRSLDNVPIEELLPKGAKLPKDYGIFDATIKSDDFVSGQKLSWFGEMNQEITRTIGRKQFHSKNAIWRDWIDHASVIGKTDKTSQLLTTTGGMTYGAPFGKAAKLQREIPFVTDVTRGLGSRLVQPIRKRIGGDVLDLYKFNLSKPFSTGAYGMRLAVLADEVVPGVPVDINVARFAQYAQLNQSQALFDSIKPHIGGAQLTQNSIEKLRKSLRKQLKGQSIKRKSGGAAIEDSVMGEIDDAAFGGRSPDFDRLELPFALTEEFIEQAKITVVRARATLKPAEKFVGRFVPEIAQAVATGRPYTPLRLSKAGSALMRQLSDAVAGGGRSPSLTSLIEEVRRVSLTGKPADFDTGLEAIRSSLHRKAKATGILDDGDKISREDMLAFFQMVNESSQTQLLMTKQLGAATPFKVRKVGNNGMWVFNIDGTRLAQTVFENPEALNRKMSAMLYGFTEDLAVDSKKITKLRRQAGKRLFDTNLGNGLNYWYESTMEAVLERLRTGVLTRTGLIERGVYLFDLGAYTRNAAVEGVADAQVTLLDSLKQALDALEGTIDITTRGPGDEFFEIIDDIVMPPNPVRRATMPNEVGVTLDSYLFDDQSVADYMDDLVDLGQTTVDRGAAAPKQWTDEIERLVTQGMTRSDAEQKVVEQQLKGFRSTMFGLNESVRASIERKYVDIMDHATATGDVAIARVLENNLRRELSEANRALNGFYQDFVDSIAGQKVAPATRSISGDDLDSLIGSASEVINGGSVKFRERQISMLETQIAGMEDGPQAALLRAEVEMLQEVDRLMEQASTGAVPGDLTIDFVSGGANGVDTMSLIYADKRRAFHASVENNRAVPSQHSVGDIGGWLPQGGVSSETSEIGSGLFSEAEELQRLGLKPLTEWYNKRSPDKLPARTMKNVDDADATIVYFPGVGGKRQGYISGGSADTVWYAMRGFYPAYQDGRKTTFSDKLLRREFNQIAEGVWVPKRPDEMHKPIMVVGYVAREHVRPDLTGSQHQAIQTWLHTTATDGRIKLNMAGPRAEKYERDLFRVDEVGNMMPELEFDEALVRVQQAIDNDTLDEFRAWVLSDPIVRGRYTELLGEATAKAGNELDDETLDAIKTRALASSLQDLSRPLKIPAMLQPDHPEYMQMRFGELRDIDGNIIREGSEPRAQSVEEFVDAFNGYLSWLADSPTFRFGGGNRITVEDVLKYNVDTVRFGELRYRRALSFIESLRAGDGNIDVALKKLEDAGVPKDRIEAVLRHADKIGDPPDEALARLSVQYSQSVVDSIQDIDGRLKGILEGRLRVSEGGSIGVGGAQTSTPLVKTVTLNQKNARIVRELAMKYGIEMEAAFEPRPVAELWDELRLLKQDGGVVEEIPVPFDLIETPGNIFGPKPEWKFDKYGEILGPVTGSAGELTVVPARIYSPREETVLRGIADEMKLPGRKTMEVNQLVAEMRRTGWITSEPFPRSKDRWVDVLGEELDVWEEAFSSKYPAVVEDGIPQGGDRVDLFKDQVPVAEGVFRDMMRIIGDRGPDVDGVTIITDLFGMDADLLIEYRRFQTLSLSDIEAERLAWIKRIEIDEKSGVVTREAAASLRLKANRIAGDSVADAESGNLTRTIYDVMEAYLTTRGFVEDEVDDIVSTFMNRFGLVGSRQDIPTTGTVLSDRLGNAADLSIEDASTAINDIGEAGLGAASVDRSELFARLGYNPDAEGPNIGEVFLDGRPIDEAEVLYAQAMVDAETLFFPADAHIRLPAVDRMKGKRYYSSDYEAGKYADLTRREARDLEEGGGYRTTLVVDPSGMPVLDAAGKKQYRQGEWVPGYGSKRQIVQGVAPDLETIDPLSRELDAIDPTQSGGLGPVQRTSTERSTSAISFGPDIEPDLLDQRPVVTPGKGFTEKLGQAAGQRPGQRGGGLGLQVTVERLMDMIISPGPGTTADTLLYDAAVASYTKVYEREMNSVLNVISSTRDLERLASMTNISMRRARDAWQLFKDTGDPDYLFDADLLKAQALVRLTQNGGSASSRPLLDVEAIVDLRRLQRDLGDGVIPDSLKRTGVFSQEQIIAVSEFVATTGNAAATRIRDEFGVSLGKANKLLEVLESNGIVGPKVRGRARQIIERETQVRPATSDIPLSPKQRGILMDMFPEMGSVPETLQANKLNSAIDTLRQRITEGDRAIAASPNQPRKVAPSFSDVQVEHAQARRRLAESSIREEFTGNEFNAESRGLAREAQQEGLADAEKALKNAGEKPMAVPYTAADRNMFEANTTFQISGTVDAVEGEFDSKVAETFAKIADRDVPGAFQKTVGTVDTLQGPLTVRTRQGTRGPMLVMTTKDGETVGYYLSGLMGIKDEYRGHGILSKAIVMTSETEDDVAMWLMLRASFVDPTDMMSFSPFTPAGSATVRRVAKDLLDKMVDEPTGTSLVTRVVRSKQKPDGATFVGRGSPFGNPFIVRGRNSKYTGQPHPFLKDEGGRAYTMREVDTTADAVAEYKKALWQTIKADPAYARRVAALQDETLWYPGRELAPTELSHARTLAAAADWLNTQGGRKYLDEPASTTTSPPPKGGAVVGQSLEETLGIEPGPTRMTEGAAEALHKEAVDIQNNPAYAGSYDPYGAAELGRKLGEGADKVFDVPAVGELLDKRVTGADLVSGETFATVFPGRHVQFSPEQLDALGAPSGGKYPHFFPLRGVADLDRNMIDPNSGMFPDALGRAGAAPEEFILVLRTSPDPVSFNQAVAEGIQVFPISDWFREKNIPVIAGTPETPTLREGMDTIIGESSMVGVLHERRQVIRQKLKDAGYDQDQPQRADKSFFGDERADVAEVVDIRTAPSAGPVKKAEIEIDKLFDDYFEALSTGDEAAIKRAVGKLEDGGGIVPDRPIEKEVGESLEDFLGTDTDVRAIIDDAPDLAKPGTAASPVTLDVAKERAAQSTRKKRLSFLEGLKRQDRAVRQQGVSPEQSVQARIDAIHPGGVPLDMMPPQTSKMILSKYSDAVKALENGGVWVGEGIGVRDLDTLRAIRKNGSTWLAPGQRSTYINSLFGNPYRPIGRRVNAAFEHPLFTSIDPETSATVRIKEMQVPNELDATSKYHDLLWDWISQSESNADQVRQLHGRTLVDVTEKASDVPSHVNVLSDAADWLFRGMRGRPQNLYRRAQPLTSLQDTILEEALDVQNATRAKFSRITSATEQAAAAVHELEAFSDMGESSGGLLVDSLLLGVDTSQRKARLEIMNMAAKRVYGDDVFVSVHSRFVPTEFPDVPGSKGTYEKYLRMRMPGDDVAAITDDSLTAFSDMVARYKAGELAADDLAGQGLDMIVQAGEIGKKIDTVNGRLTEMLERTGARGADADKVMGVQAAAEQTAADFNSLLNHIWSSISTGRTRALRRFIGIQDDLTLNATPEWERIDSLLKAKLLSRDEEQLVRFWVDAAGSAEWDWGSQNEWMRGWQRMRAPHDGPIGSPKARAVTRAEVYDDAVDAAVKLDDAVATKLGMAERLGLTEKMHRDAIRFIESTIQNLEQSADLLRTTDNPNGFVTPMMDGVRLDPRRVPGKTVQGAQGSGYVYTPGRAGNHDSYAELMVAIYSDLDQLYNDEGLRSLVDQVMVIDGESMGRVFTDTDMRNLKGLHQQYSRFYDTSQPWWQLHPTNPEMFATDTYGLGGTLSNYFIDPMVGNEMMQADRRMASMATQRGMNMVLSTSQRLADWWKRAATLPKLTFHFRNLVGGMWNNMMIGAGPIRHVKMLPDTVKFLRAKRKADLMGWDPSLGTGDAIEDMVIGAVSEKNRELFRSAYRNNVFETSFTGTVSSVAPLHGKWDRANPFARGFYGYEAGGNVMEEVETLLRVTAYSRYFDPEYPFLSGQLGRTMTNMVHFDYSDTTDFEDRYIKKFVPFWVWQKNNLPLQIRMAIQQPRFINTYEKARKAWNDTAIEDDDENARYYRSNGWVMPFLRRENEEGWAQMMWRPDLPFNDLTALPLFGGYKTMSVNGFETPFGNDATNLASWATWSTDMMGPLGQLAVNLTSEEKRSTRPGYTGDLAPVGINGIADIFNVGTRTPQGNRLIPKTISESAMTLMPFWYEYMDLAGQSAVSPYRGANQGILPGEELVTSPLKGALVSGSKLASGFGFRWFGPKDIFFMDRELESYLDELNRIRRIQSSSPTGE